MVHLNKKYFENTESFQLAIIDLLIQSKHCDGSFVIPKSVIKEVWAHNRMKKVDVLDHRIGEYYHQNIIFYKELLSDKVRSPHAKL